MSIKSFVKIMHTCKECGQPIRCEEKFSCPHCKKEISADALDGMCWDKNHCYHKSKLAALTAVFLFIILVVVIIAKAKAYSMCGNTGWDYSKGIKSSQMMRY